jgi:acetyl esterase/lipase
MTDTLETHKNVVYAAPAEGVRLELDVYVSNSSVDEHRPAVLLIHGGGWSSGSKLDMARTARQLASRGFAVFAINYRLAPQFVFPAQLEDCAAAVNWIRENADAYRVDPKKIGAFGYSAGGHLAALLGVTQHGRDALQCVVAGGGVYDFQSVPEHCGELSYWLGGSRCKFGEWYREASPLAHVNAQTNRMPYLFFHGEKDTVCPITTVEPMAAKLRDVCGCHAEVVLVEGGHLAAALDHDCISAAVDFLGRHLHMRQKKQSGHQEFAADFGREDPVGRFPRQVTTEPSASASASASAAAAS